MQFDSDEYTACAVGRNCL